MNKENERIEKSKKGRKMTLKDYYEQLPEASHPKTDFVNRVVLRTGVSVQTVRNWVIYGMKPSRTECVKVLSEETGIPEKELWND